MDKYACTMCGHIYDPAKGEKWDYCVTLVNSANALPEIGKTGIRAGTDFSAVPASFRCPTCGYPKSYYRKIVPATLHSMRTIDF
jgi:rubredoxin